MNASLILVLTDLFALLVVALAAWKVTVVVRARFRPPAGADRKGCEGCAGCQARPSLRVDNASD
ncbi:MAG: hypothetical protein KBF58_09625 [Methyloversatilis sp.]|nr:hypothetical protein [Methyloversatilis sp.]MBP9118328.1 hypothetical protein [Methyloversatilis sp.]